VIENTESMERVHTRQITCHGYKRKDGLYQIEATVFDEKGQTVPFRTRPDILPGERIHSFSLTVVIDADYTIRDAAAKTLAAPWPVCTDVAADYRKLVGLRIGPGFNRGVREVLGGPLGCTHLTDLLGQVGNTYMQTSFPDRMARQRRVSDDPRLWPDKASLGFIDGCIAWRRDSPAVAAEYPQLAGDEGGKE
jgi:hypothetical protein